MFGVKVEVGLSGMVETLGSGGGNYKQEALRLRPGPGAKSDSALMDEDG